MSGPGRRPRGRVDRPARQRPCGPVPVTALVVAGSVATTVRPAMTGAAYASPVEAGELTGPVVAADLPLTFTAAAVALAGGATGVVLVDSIAEAVAYGVSSPAALAVGRPQGRTLAGVLAVAGAAGVIAGRDVVLVSPGAAAAAVVARQVARLWCASLMVASATARSVASSGVGAPTYVLDQRSPAQRLAVEAVERARVGGVPDQPWATAVDVFDFAVEAAWLGGRLRLQAVRPNW